jgi:hypothetical protein
VSVVRPDAERCPRSKASRPRLATLDDIVGSHPSKEYAHSALELRFLGSQLTPRHTDGAGGRLAPAVRCRSTKRFVPSVSVSSASKALSMISPAMSAETSRDQPSSVLKATTHSAFSYWPAMKLRMMVSRSAAARSVSR